MGQEARCQVRFGKKAAEGRALLEAEELLFQGDFKLRIPFKAVRSVEARGGRLTVVWPDGTASFDLGAQAEKWALKIRYPRGLLDKLGVKPWARVSVVGIDDARFRAQLRERTEDVSEGRAAKDSDLVFVAMQKTADLVKLVKLRDAIKKNGAIWVLWPKGRKEFREDDVRAFGPEAGLVDVKVVSFSETLSALKMVIPLKQRG
jgi:hypothetical protein